MSGVEWWSVGCVASLLSPSQSLWSDHSTEQQPQLLIAGQHVGQHTGLHREATQTPQTTPLPSINSRAYTAVWWCCCAVVCVDCVVVLSVSV